MNKKILAAAMGAALAAGPMLSAQAEIKVKWFGFMQLTAEQLSEKKATDEDGITFSTDRVRIGFKVKDGPVFGKLQVDFEKGDKGENPATMPEIIKDALAGYKVNSAVKISLGIFKTPVGMDFNTSGKKLNITKRGMEKALVLERATGLMVSGRKIGGGFGYDVFYGDPSTRSSSVADGTRGSDTTTAFRVMYDMGKTLHLEASSGTSAQAGGVGSEDYSVMDVAGKWKSGPITAKFEYISGSNVSGTDGNDESVWFLHGGYKVTPKIELVGRHYSASCETCGGGAESDRTNTYIGANFFLGSKKTNGRLQLNYVAVGGDDIDATPSYGGKAKGFSDSAILVQYQVSF